ncbi:type II toxin-antitoxin system VapC family toxin [Pyrodictium delaneyi]|nr:type II toxin-antitoxin system VapC family toxin [Pyrodictium delaneyi]
MSVKEVANALWKKTLRGEMNSDDAAKIVADLASGTVPLYSQEP